LKPPALFDCALFNSKAMFDCKKATRLVSERPHRPLVWRERAGLALHLAMCVYCRRFARQIALMRHSLDLARRRALDDPPPLDTATRTRLQDALDAAHPDPHGKPEP
jgi:hypothetical protein